LLEKQLRRERAGGCGRIGAGCVVDDRVLDVSAVSGLGIRVEHLLSQSICCSIAELAECPGRGSNPHLPKKRGV
jgi:hypothetical protein